MGDCIFCGRSAGFLKKQHKECARQHQAGKAEILSILADAASSNADDMPRVLSYVRKTAGASYIDNKAMDKLFVAGYDRAVENVLDDHILSQEEEKALTALERELPVSKQLLDKNGSLSKLTKAAILRDLSDGIIPKRIRVSGPMPFNLQKSESLVWVFQDVQYYEERSRREFRGRSHGISLRVTKGVYYRVGDFKGKPVEHTESVLADIGVMGITTKHIYFAGQSKRFRIRYDRIVTFDAFSDGIGVMREAQSAKPQTFRTGDGWFTYNLVSSLAQL